MKLCQLSIIKNFPVRPWVRDKDGKLVKPGWRVLWGMYGKVDYVLRVVGQVVEGYPDGIFTSEELLTLVYVYVGERQGYMELRKSVVGMMLKKEEEGRGREVGLWKIAKD